MKRKTSCPTTEKDNISYKPCGSSMNIHISMEETTKVGHQHSEDVTGLVPVEMRSKQNKKTVLRPFARGNINIFEAIEPTCSFFRQKMDRKTIVLRDADNSFFRNLFFCDAEPFIIEGVDPIEVVDHIRTNSERSRLMVRMTFPKQEDHDLIKTLKRQVDSTTFDDMMKTAQEEEGLMLIAFTTMYMNELAGHQQNVDELIFHSLILITRPLSKADNHIRVPLMWTSDAYDGALLDRLMQIACILFWRSKKALVIKTQTAAVSKRKKLLYWDGQYETIADIAARFGGDQPRFQMTTQMEEWVVKAKEKTTKIAPKMLANLEELLLPAVVQFATQEVGEDDNERESSVKIPLAFFTHFLSKSQAITELGAELLQIASIIPVTSRHTTDVNAKLNDWSYCLKCRCCGQAMNTSLDFVTLISLGTRIINHHYLGHDNVSLHKILGDIRTNDIPSGFVIYPCEGWSGSGSSQSTLMRMRFCDATKIDNACHPDRHRHLICNTLALTSTLLPTDVTSDTLDQYPLVDGLLKMMNKLFQTDVNKVMPTSMSNSLTIQDLTSVLTGRPIQVQITDFRVDSIATLKSDPSWDESVEDKVALSMSKQSLVSSKEEFAKRKSMETFNVGNLEVGDDAVAVYTPRDGKGNQVLYMLSYYYANCVIAIEPGMSFRQLKNSVGNKVSLPKELDTFMAQYTITKKTLVVIADFGRAQNRSSHSAIRLSELTTEMKSNIAWFIPTDFFLKLLPKANVDALLNGKVKTLKICQDLRKKLRDPIETSLKYEIKNLRLYSLYPNKILEVTLSSGSNIFINANNEIECLKNIQEHWLLESLSSLLHVAGLTGVAIGIGKKATPDASRPTSYMANTNVWSDARNKYNLCVSGAIANWLHAEGLHYQASMMKEWAESQNLFTIDVDPMKEALEYIKAQFRIRNVVINLRKNLSLQETATLFSDFQAPTILEFQSISSHQTHSLVVSNKVVYDFQERHPYDLNLSSLTRKLNGNKDVVVLVSARYFYSPEKSTPSCPTKEILHDTSWRKLIHSFGKQKRTSGQKRNKKRKRT